MSLQSIQDQQQPLHICITGSSQGIGLAAAKRLVENGHVVYHACRTKARAQAAVDAAGGGIPLVCNLADFHSIRSFAHELNTKAPRLDVLCLNAGMSPSVRPTPRLTAQGYEECIGVNHLGNFLLANLLYPKLAQNENGGGRLVLTASSVHDPETRSGKSGGGHGATLGNLVGLGVNLAETPSGPTMVDGSTEYSSGGKVYKDSKLCNILMCRRAVEKFPKISTVCFNPGFVPTTGLFHSLRTDNWWKAEALTWVAKMMGIAIPVQVAGDRMVYMATTTTFVDSSSNNYYNGSYYCAPTKSLGTTPSDGFVDTPVSKEASDADLGARLWERSLEIVGDWL
jgi:NAD(P)-dependent dehydrogenase (short-subunit alcohol dehydrogenase family)